MKVNEFIEKNGFTAVNIADGEREIESGYAGDFLSYAISKMGNNAAWFTVMNNVNVLGVASLADVALVVVCDNVPVPQETLARAKQQSINVCKSFDDVYESVKKAAPLI